MADLYQAVAGSVIVTSISSPSFLSIDGFDGLASSGKMIITGLKIERGQDFQVVKTLSNAFYLYAFGEAAGRIMVAGLLFFADCGSKSITAQAISDINGYYEQNNIYFQDNAVQIAADGASYAAYLVGLSIVAEQNQFNYGSFSLDFLFVPPSAGQAGNSNASNSSGGGGGGSDSGSASTGGASSDSGDGSDGSGFTDVPLTDGATTGVGLGDINTNTGNTA